MEAFRSLDSTTTQYLGNDPMPQKSHSFIVDKIYKRQQDIHEPYGGQRQSGISTPAKAPFVFVFTGDGGETFGYKDSPMPDGTYWYTGEGQSGDMQMIKGNAAIKNHRERGKQLLFFESVPGNQIRFLGEVEYLGHHTETRPDVSGQLRQALIFHLGFVANEPKPGETSSATTYPDGKLPSKLSLQELRAIATTGESSAASTKEKLINVKLRAEAVKRYALARASGVCEGCKDPAPFKTRQGPFLEVHHVYRLSDGGPDHPANVIALCPNCHRRAHYSTDSEQFNDELSLWLKQNEVS